MGRIDDILRAAEEARQNRENLDTSEAKEVTAALYELLKQNGRPSSKKDKHFYLVESCLNALREDKAIQARAFYSQIPLGGNGCFNDWQSERPLELSGNKYDGVDFEKIVIDWSNTMRSIHI